VAYRGSSFGFGYGLTPWVQRLLIANTAVFVLQNILSDLTYFMAFVPAGAIVRPWTIVTYMFAHGGFMHLLLNMIGLFFFGPPLEERLGSRDFLIFYFICGLGGAVLSFVFAFNSPIIGASAAVYGVLLAFAIFWPDVQIYIWGILPVKAKWLVGVIVAISIMNAFGGRQDGTAHFAHLGGFVAAFLYLRFAGHRRYGGGIMSRLKGALPQRRNKNLTVVSGREPPPPPRATLRRRGEDDDRMLDDLDRILDKISTQGISSLTPEERRLLDDASRRYKQN
jgi:membrane associated rhomboid family serine protease